MKKVLSSLLLVVFLFNVGGYYLVFWGLRYQADQKLTVRLDANLYDRAETIELRIPLTLPYPIQSEGFRRVDGRFEHSGQFYKLVKQKLENDTLTVVCIRDVQTRDLVNTIRDYVQLTLDLPGTPAGKAALNFLGKLAMDFCSNNEITFVDDYQIKASVLFTERPEFFLEPAIAVLGPPPKL